MEIIEKLKSIFLRRPQPFVEKRDINWKAVNLSAAGGLVTAIVAILLLPGREASQQTFDKQVAANPTEGTSSRSSGDASDAWVESNSRHNRDSVPANLDSVLHRASGIREDGSSDKSTAMVITRDGVDLNSQLQPGTRVRVRLLERVVLTEQARPVIGIVIRPVDGAGTHAIAEGAKLFGVGTFDSETGRAQITWRAIQTADGRERSLTGSSLDLDELSGVRGRVHSDGLKNFVGHTASKFAAAYAEGSMQTGPLGANAGGHINGMRNAVSQVAQEQAESWATDIKKEISWIEVASDVEFILLLTQPFVFRDPGSLIGG